MQSVNCLVEVRRVRVGALLWLLFLSGTSIALPRDVGAQETDPIFVGSEVFANSELERYLRALQITGQAPLSSWSIRGLSDLQIERSAPVNPHAWSHRFSFADTTEGLRARALRPSALLIHNSKFPYGDNDGALWAGRGLTYALSAGAAMAYGPLRLRVAPLWFSTDNGQFELPVRGRRLTGKAAYGDYLKPDNIDFPQRFGDTGYSGLDLGQSSLRVELPFVSAGVSNSNQVWGPAAEFPILIGNSAPGFPHGFIGTPRPMDVWLGRFHGRYIVGIPDQSDYSPAPDSLSRRAVTGLIVSFSPRGAPGLEIGAARFFHERWPEGGFSAGYLLRPLQSLLTTYLPVLRDEENPDWARSASDNQLASVFARWAFPASGFEFYGEFGREDANFDFRDLVLEPDQQSAYTVGIRKAWARTPTSFLVLHGEVANGQVSHLQRVRQQLPFYSHSAVVQGHTNRGQLIGSPAIHGGQGSVLGLDYYSPEGRVSFDWKRHLRSEWSEYWLGNLSMDNLTGFDVVNGVGITGVLFMSRFDVQAGARALWNLNRDFTRDVFSTNLFFGLTAAL